MERARAEDIERQTSQGAEVKGQSAGSFPPGTESSNRFSGAHPAIAITELAVARNWKFESNSRLSQRI